MKNKVFSWFMVLALLVSVICVPVSASTGKVSDAGVRDLIVYQDQAEKAWASNNSLTSGSVGKLQQHHLNTVATDLASDDYFGALSFKIKADEANMTYSENRDTFTFIVQDVDANSSTKNNENNVFIMDYSGYMRANYSETGWNNTVGTPYEKGTWYTIGILLKKDGYYDCFIDGVKVSTTKYNKEWSTATTALKFLFNISNNGIYYIDELTWSKYEEDSFIASGNKAKVGNGGSIAISFSETVASYDLSEIKAFECESGEEVDGIEASFEDETLTVKMPENSMTAGKEYRIELNDIKGAMGCELVTDNIYFNCEVEGSEKTDIIGSDDFDNFSASTASVPSPDADYYQPAGWYLGHKWNSQTGAFVRPVSGDASYATAMQIGIQGRDGGSSNAYMPLGQKVDSGVVKISYSMKPERAIRDYLTGGSLINNGFAPNLMVMVYPDGIDASDNTWAQGDSVSIGKDAYGKTIAGIFSHKIAAVNTIWNSNDHKVLKNLTMDATDENKVAASDSVWYEMEIELDFDKGTTTYWINGAKTEGASLATLGVDGIQGISFGTRSNATDASTLIDNVKVEYTHIANIKTANVGSEDFDDFATNYTNPLVTDADYCQPEGWYLGHRWNSQVSGFFRPVTDAEMGEVLQLGNAGSDGGSTHGYMPLNKNISSGIVTISYDFKPERLSDYWNDSWQDARTPNFVLMVYPDGIDESDLSWKQGDSVSIGKPGTDARYVAGIFAHTIGASRLPGVGNNTDQRIPLKELTMDSADAKKVSSADSKWYNMKIELNFDAGTTTYWLDGEKTSGELLATLNIDAIQGISIGNIANARDTSVLVDNIMVTHTFEDVSGAGVMQTRFSDYYGNNYGTATTMPTVLDTVAISFWTTSLDKDSLNTNTIRLVNTNDNSEIYYVPDYDEENGIYLMNLREYLTNDTEYMLVVDGVTAGGEDIESYEQIITSDAEGVVITEPLYIWKNADEAQSGTLEDGDTITAGTRLINTTDEEKTYAFFMALYEGNKLYMADFEEITMDGYSTPENKEANVSASFTMSEADAKAVTKVKAFLWEGMDTMKPVLPVVEFNKTAN